MVHLCFPGLIAPASLKHAAQSNHIPTACLFSGVNCPGLIEAHAPAHLPQKPLSFSGVNCPGLIEALTTRPDSVAPPSVFRG